MKLWMLVVVAVCLSSCGGKSPERSANIERVSRLELTDLSDNPIDLDKFKGKVLFVNVWATWCAPCLKEMPSIEQATKQFKAEEVKFLFASNESSEEILDFVKGHPSDVEFVRLANFDELNISALPTTYIFNKTGEAVYAEAGYRQWDEPSALEFISQIVNK